MSYTYRLEKLRSVLSSFQTDVSDIEQRQAQQRTKAHNSLKREMTALHQKMIQQTVCMIYTTHYKIIPLSSLFLLSSLPARLSITKDEAGIKSCDNETITSHDISHDSHCSVNVVISLSNNNSTTHRALANTQKQHTEITVQQISFSLNNSSRP